MKRILSLLVFLLVSLVGMAQAPTNYTNINGRYRWIAGMFDSTFHIPKGTTPSLRTGGSTNAGALFYKTSDSTIYYYTGSRWLKLSDSMRYVPYTGAINNVDLGTYGLTGDFIKLNVSPSGVPSTESTMSWNNTDGTMDIKLKGGAVTLQVGQEQVVRVVNKTGVNLLESEYKAVYLSGAQGQRAKIDLAQANSALGNMTIGLVTENIDNNQEGYITSNGLVRGINTTGSLQSETWADGDALYLSPTTAGAVTNIAPTAPNYQISIGIVVNAHATQGSIFVKVGFSEALNDLSDVQLNGLANNDLLVYESSSSLWKNKTFSAAGGITGSGTTNYVSKFTSSSAIGNSSIFDNGTSVGIGTASPSATYKLDVNGEASINGVRVGRGAGNDASNTAVGAMALNANTSALNNSAFGNQALLSTTSGGMNVALGVTAMRFNTTGFQNVAVGVSAGHFTNSYGSNAASDNSVYLGYETKASASGNTNEIVIGASALGGGSNTVTLGNSSILNTYLKGQANVATINNATTDTDKFLVSDGGVVKYRTGAEVLSDIGGASSSSISGTTNYIPKFTSSSAIGNSLLYDNGTNVGIGTVVPDELLTLNKAGSLYTRIVNTSNSVSTYWGVNGTDIYFGSSSNSPVTFYSNSTERMRLTSGGSLGIGTSAPVNLLHLYGTDGNSYLRWTSNIATTGARIGYNGTEFRIDQQENAAITFRTNLSERMRLDASGRLGLGTTSPSVLLDIVGTSATEQFRIGNSTGGTDFGITVTENASTIINSAEGATGRGIQFQSGGTNTVLIDASGNLGLGISAPNELLSLNATGNVNIHLTNATSGTTTNDGFKVGFNTSLNAYLLNKEAGSILFYTSDALRATLDASGNLGLGVTPAAWGSAFKAMQINAGGAVWGSTNVTEVNIGGNTRVDVNNAQYDYISTGAASQYQQSGGQHIWKTAASGTAGNAISFTQAMTLFSTGNLAVGGTSDAGYKLDVNGTGRFSGDVLATSSGNTSIKATSTAGFPLFQLTKTGGVTWNLENGRTGNVFGIYQSGGTGGGVTYFSIAEGGGATVNTTLSVTSAATFSSSVSATSFNGTTQNIFAVNGTEGMRLTTTGLGIGTTSPTSTLHTNGSVATAYSSKTATYTLTSSDHTIRFDAVTAASSLTANLPDATTCTGRIYVILAKMSSSYNVTLDGNGSQTIGGSTTWGLWDGCNLDATIVIQSDGANWQIISYYGYNSTC